MTCIFLADNGAGAAICTTTLNVADHKSTALMNSFHYYTTVITILSAMMIGLQQVHDDRRKAFNFRNKEINTVVTTADL